MNDARLRTILMVAAVYHLLLGAFMAFAPGEFYDSLGKFPPRNDHYIKDVSTFYIALGVYNIVDDLPAPANEFIPYLAELVGAKKPRRIPAWVARLAAGRMVDFATSLQPVSNALAKHYLDWRLRYPTWREGFRAELG